MRPICICIAIIFALVSIPTSGAETPYQTGVLFDSPKVKASDYTEFCLDRDGFLWIGTKRGLIRFDGMEYDLYTHDERTETSLSDHRTLDLLCDSKGRLWVATANGLNLYDPRTDSFRTVSFEGKPLRGYIIAVDEQPDGTITFINSGHGLFVISEKEDGGIDAVSYMNLLTNKRAFNTLECGSDGTLYIGDADGNVNIVSKNGAQTIVNAGDSYVNDIELESDGNLLINICDDIFRLDTQTKHLSRLKTSCQARVLKFSSNYSSDGFVYVGTMKGGVFRIKPGSDTVERCHNFYSPSIDVNKSKVTAVFCAPDNTLWLGCDYKGILMVPSHGIPFTYHRLSDYYDDFNGGIDCLSQWQGNLLIATEGRLSLISPQGELLRTYPVPGNARVTSIRHGEDDRFLIGIPTQGVKELSMTSGSWRKIVDIPGNYLSLVMESAGDGEFFVGVHAKGLMRYSMSTGETRWLKGDGDDDSGLLNNYVNVLHLTSDGKLWIGFYGGMGYYDLRSGKYVNIEDFSVSNATVNALTSVGDSLLLVGTCQGLIEYSLKTGKTKRYASSDGLSDNEVRTIEIDGNGGRWIGTVNGMSYQDAETRKISAYYGALGLQENAFNHSVEAARGNNIYFTSDLGFTEFNPDYIPVDGWKGGAPKISAIYIRGRKIVPSDKIGRRFMIEGYALQPETINLPTNDNSMRLRLTTMDFRDASNVIWRWRTGDGDDAWNENRPGENEIHLPNFSPGEHMIQIQGIENGKMSPVFNLRIRVAYPWYLSPVAIIIYVLVLAGLLYLVFALLKKKRVERENDAKIKFFMNLSHDIRSPITLMLSPIEELIKRPFDDDVKHELKTIKRNGQRILSLVNQMLDLRKLEKGKMRLLCRKTYVAQFTGGLVDLFKPQAQQSGLNLEYEDRFGEDRIWLDRDNVDKILVNLISNAIKYTPKGGSVKVLTDVCEVADLGRCLRINVIDTGIGLDAKLESKVFERFYQAGNEGAVSGFGIGLDLCRGLAELHHGRIEGHNRNDGVKGSVFTVYIPISDSVYSDEELAGDDKAKLQAERSSDIVSAVESSSFEPPTSSQKKSKAMKRVIIVDDHDELRHYLKRQLSEYYKVSEAADGQTALKMIIDKVPDIVVSDVKMPGLDGLELLKRLKRNDQTAHIPVILLSSLNEVADRMAGWNSGADGYIGKPFTLEELKTLIDNLIENRQKVKGKASGVSETEGKIVHPEVKGNDEILMERVMRVTDKHISEPDFNVEQLSAEAGISRAHLHRKMKETIGITPSDFIRNIRLKRAAELLRKPDIEVTQIAYIVGYNSQPHFSTVFKKFTGYTPSEYRSKYLNSEESTDSDS